MLTIGQSLLQIIPQITFILMRHTEYALLLLCFLYVTMFSFIPTICLMLNAVKTTVRGFLLFRTRDYKTNILNLASPAKTSPTKHSSITFSLLRSFPRYQPLSAEFYTWEPRPDHESSEWACTCIGE